MYEALVEFGIVFFSFKKYFDAKKNEKEANRWIYINAFSFSPFYAANKKSMLSHNRTRRKKKKNLIIFSQEERH
jgi:hypothetical protein